MTGAFRIKIIHVRTVILRTSECVGAQHEKVSIFPLLRLNHRDQALLQIKSKKRFNSTSFKILSIPYPKMILETSHYL